jgi:RNA recognition motif-containing protein
MGKRNVFVSGLSTALDDAALLELFKPAGKVLNAKVMLDVDTGASKGFGFVLFDTEEAAEVAVAKFDGMAIGGCKLRVAISRHDAENVMVETNRMHVRNVPHDVSDSQLNDHFRQFGTVVQLRSELDVSFTPPRRIITVKFSDFESVTAAVNGTHGKKLFPQCAVPLLAKPSEPRGMRKQRLRAERQAAAAGTSPAAAPHHKPPSPPSSQPSTPKVPSEKSQPPSPSITNTAAPEPVLNAQPQTIQIQQFQHAFPINITGGPPGLNRVVLIPQGTNLSDSPMISNTQQQPIMFVMQGMPSQNQQMPQFQHLQPIGTQMPQFSQQLHHVPQQQFSQHQFMQPPHHVPQQTPMMPFLRLNSMPQVGNPSQTAQMPMRVW